MSERTWRGTWWVAGEQDAQRPGVLHCEEDGRLRLELIGGFNDEIRKPLSSGNGYEVSWESRDFPVILGVSGTDVFTLLNSHAVRTTRLGFGDDITLQNLAPNRALRGIHLASTDEAVFIRSHLQLERLLHWAARTTLDLNFIVDDNNIRERRAATHDLPTVTAEYEGFTLKLRVRNNDFNIVQRPVSNRRSLETVEWATLDFETPHAVSFDAFDTIDKDMQDLLTLSAYEPCGSHGQTLIYETSDAHPGLQDTKEVEVIGRQVYRTEAGAEEKSHHEFLFTLSDLDFAELVPRWLALKDRARLGYNILFGLRYISAGYVGPRLLGAATAAESVHRALCSTSKPLPSDVYNALKTKLLEAVRDEPDHLREFVKLGLRNDPTYNGRMLELAAIPDAQAVDDLLTNRVEWAKRLKNARHNLAHANDRSAQETDSSSALWLLEVTYALLCMVAMAKLGLSAEAQRRAGQNQRVMWAAAQFAKDLMPRDLPDKMRAARDS